MNAASSAAKATTKIVLGVKVIKGMSDYMREQVATFEKNTPGVHVDVYDLLGGGPAGQWPVRLKTLLIGDAPGSPDVLSFEVTQAANLYSLAALQPFDDLLRSDTTFKLADLVDPTVQVYQYKGHQMGIPNRTDMRFFMVNKTLLQRYGVTAPGDDWTLEQLMDAAQKVTKTTAGQPSSWGFGGENWRVGAPLPHWWLFGATLVDDARQKTFFDAPEAIAALQWSVDAAQKYKVTWPPSTPPKPEPPFEHAQLAFEHTNPEGYGVVQQALAQAGATQFDWDILPEPQGKARATVVTAEGYYIRQGTKQGDLGWQLVKQLMSSEAQLAYFQQLGIWPARKDFFTLPVFRDPKVAPKNLAHVFDSSLPIARTYPMTPDFTTWMFDPATKAFKDAVDGKVSAEDAAKQAQQMAQQTLSTINQRSPS